MAKLSDADVIAASVNDPDRFGVIWRRHGEAIYRYALRRTGRTNARDIAAEAFLRAFEKRGRYRKLRENCLPWLYAIAYNVIRERGRKANRHKESYLAASEPLDGWFEDGVEERVVAQSVGNELNEALAVLSDDDRETLLLFALERLTYSEIATTLGVPPGTVASRINRARRIITQHIPDLEYRVSLMRRPAGGVEGGNGG